MSFTVSEDRDTTGFGLRLRTLRIERGLTLDALAERAGMKHQNIVRFESGGREPNWQTVLRLAAALGVTPDAFLPLDELSE